MRNILTFSVFLACAVMLTVMITISTTNKSQALASVQQIDGSIEEFLDTVCDKGAMSERDYNVLLTNLGQTGGAFEVVVTVDRLYAIPNSELGFTNEYRPAYGFSTEEQNFPIGKDYSDEIFRPTQYFRKMDLVNIKIKQVLAMDYQIQGLRILGTNMKLKTWTASKGVRSSGNSIVNSDEDYSPGPR